MTTNVLRVTDNFLIFREQNEKKNASSQSKFRAQIKLLQFKNCLLTRIYNLSFFFIQIHDSVFEVDGILEF